MRNIYIIYTLSALLLMPGCDQLLDIEEEGQITGDVLVNQETIEQVLTGAYYNLAGNNDGAAGGELFGGDFILIPNLLALLPGQEYIWTSSQAIDYLVFTERDGNPNQKIIANNARVQQNWVRAFETINQVNAILENIENVSDANDRDRIQGECLAIRGILYFEMVRLWGPDFQIGSNVPSIPIITEPIDEISKIQTPTLEPVSAVYTQVENDLTEASTLLEPFGKNGTRMNYYVCQSYLARLSMHRREFAQAILYTDNVINSGEFSLVPFPYLAFNNVSNSSEDVFAIQQSLNNNSGDRTSGTGLVSFMSSLTESGIGQFQVIASSLNNTNLINSPKFNIGDQRAGFITNADVNTTSSELSEALYYNNILNEGSFSCAKYTSSENVIPVIRLAELLLLRSEALCEINGVNSLSISDLNQIRARAGIPTVLESDFSNELVLMDSIRLESKREFAFEGHLLHNLRRWEGTIGAVIGNQEDPLDNEFLFDIPQSEQDTW